MSAQVLDISEKMNAVYHPYYWNDKRFLVLYGGAGSGKSVFATQKIILRCLQNSGHRFLVCRKVARTIKKSVFQLFLDVLSDWGLLKKCKVNRTDFQITIPSGDGGESHVWFTGMDDPEKIKSIAGITGVWCEEVTEFEQGDLDQLDLRLRGNPIEYHQIMLTFNPIDERHWIKTRFFDNEKGNASLLQTTYRDNDKLNKEYVTRLEDLINQDENLHRIYVKGEWGIIKTGEEFFDKFSRSIHVGDWKRNKEYVPILIIDYNNRPYMTCTVIEKRPDVQMYVQVSEFCMKPPNSVESLVEWVVRELDLDYCYYLDDPSGKSNTAKKTRQEARSLSEQLDRSFIDQRVNAKRLDLRKAPPLATRKRAWTQILTGKTGWRYVVDENCKHTIGDFESLQTDTSGAFVKKKVRDKASGATFEEGGHCADTLTYFFTYEFPELFKSGGGFGF